MSNRTISTARISPESHGLDLPEAPSFARVLREHTQAIHREAERAGFIADLIRGRATRDGYVLFLRNLVPVYDALEAALAERAGPLYAPFADRALHRGAALRADLAALAGPDWAARWALLPEAEGYARAVASAAEDDRLVAHAYARYLGDLSGGQILKPVLARTLGLGPEALGFYDFAPAVAVAERKEAIRAALDRIDPLAPAAEVIVTEAIGAFRHNMALALAVQVAAG